MTTKELERIREMCEKAPHGPFFVDDESINARDFLAAHKDSGLAQVDNGTKEMFPLFGEWDSARYAAEAMTLVPTLLTEVERLRKTAERISIERDQMVDKRDAEIKRLRGLVERGTERVRAIECTCRSVPGMSGHQQCSRCQLLDDAGRKG